VCDREMSEMKTESEPDFSTKFDPGGKK
jgi:hypothetical protein